MTTNKDGDRNENATAKVYCWAIKDKKRNKFIWFNSQAEEKLCFDALRPCPDLFLDKQHAKTSVGVGYKAVMVKIEEAK